MNRISKTLASLVLGFPPSVSWLPSLHLRRPLRSN